MYFNAAVVFVMKKFIQIGPCHIVNGTSLFSNTPAFPKKIEFHTGRIWKLKEFPVKPQVYENKNDPSEIISPHCALVLIRFCHAFARQMLQIRLYLLFTISFFLVVLLWLMHSRLWNFLSYFIFIGILDLRKK